MVARNYFAHRDPTTNENMVKAQPFCVYTSENIVWIKYQTPAEDNQEAVGTWLSSPLTKRLCSVHLIRLTGVALSSGRIVQNILINNKSLNLNC